MNPDGIRIRIIMCTDWTDYAAVCYGSRSVRPCIKNCSLLNIPFQIEVRNILFDVCFHYTFLHLKKKQYISIYYI